MDGDPSDPAYRRQLIDTFINSVWLYDDKLVLTYNYSGEGSTVTLDMVDAALEDDKNTCSNSALYSPPKKHNIVELNSRVVLLYFVCYN